VTAVGSQSRRRQANPLPLFTSSTVAFGKCGAETSRSAFTTAPTFEVTMTANINIVRTLNDRLRKDFSTGRAVITTGVAALGAEVVARIVKTIAVYDDFCHANDPYEEHDFGAFEVDGSTIFFKIDYYDKTLGQHSPDPSDPSVTERVITVMLAEEY
jgi:Protein of unknown function (DUF3768)